MENIKIETTLFNWLCIYTSYRKIWRKFLSIRSFGSHCTTAIFLINVSGFSGKAQHMKISIHYRQLAKFKNAFARLHLSFGCYIVNVKQLGRTEEQTQRIEGWPNTNAIFYVSIDGFLLKKYNPVVSAFICYHFLKFSCRVAGFYYNSVFSWWSTVLEP